MLFLLLFHSCATQGLIRYTRGRKSQGSLRDFADDFYFSTILKEMPAELPFILIALHVALGFETLTCW